MNAKTFLAQNSIWEKEVIRKKEQLARDRSLLEKCTAAYGGVKVRTSGQAGLDAGLVRYEKSLRELDAAILKLTEAKEEIEAVLSQVSNNLSRLVLEYRYLCCCDKMAIIADNLGISRSYAYVLEAAGLKEVDQILTGRPNHAA